MGAVLELRDYMPDSGHRGTNKVVLTKCRCNQKSRIYRYSNKEIEEIVELETNYSSVEEFDELWD